MRSRMSIVVAMLAIAATTPALAGASNTDRVVKHNYALDYQFVHAHTDRPAGCNLLAHKCADDRNPTTSDLARSDRWLNAEIAVFKAEQAAAARAAASSLIASAAHSTTSPTSVTVLAPTTGGLPPSCADESKGNYSTGPANTNGATGATGRWQITPPTAEQYHCSLATPAGQDACAAQVWIHQGRSAWVHC